ncbi:hypothetical protein ACOSP7_007311 [Xanthoceras sorbifolium]
MEFYVDFSLYDIIKRKKKNRENQQTTKRNPDPSTIFELVARIVVATEDRYPVVEQKQDQNKKKRDSNRRPADPVDGVGFSGVENAGDNRAAIGGEELDCEEENDGQEEETDRAQELGDELRQSLAGVAKEERDQHHYADDHRQ